MNFDEQADNLQAYLKKIKDVKDDKCWFCHRTPDQIRQEFFEYMKHPKEDFEDMELDDIAIMTYKTKFPVCAACYFTIKKNPDLIREILESSDEEMW